MKVKVVVLNADGHVFTHCDCTSQPGEEHELQPTPTNSNQAEAFCYVCHDFLGYDHSIQPSEGEYK